MNTHSLLRPLTDQTTCSTLSALLMILAGIGLSIAGFVRDPMGEISDSVLWFVAQSLIYAGSVFGVTVYVDQKVAQLQRGRTAPAGAKVQA